MEISLHDELYGGLSHRLVVLMVALAAAFFLIIPRPPSHHHTGAHNIIAPLSARIDLVGEQCSWRRGSN